MSNNHLLKLSYKDNRICAPVGPGLIQKYFASLYENMLTEKAIYFVRQRGAKFKSIRFEIRELFRAALISKQLKKARALAKHSSSYASFFALFSV
jgi:hypothetical protein